jgi:alkanesulfonate monooxygenase SsuD/methylene tetrahydromethanopterin reductase-like flavin-dependent oxidoreductase (luciferase family)
LKAYVSDVRAKAAAAGRDPKKIFIYNLVTVIVGETGVKAKAKFEDYQRYASYDGSLVFMSGWSGIDFGRFNPADVIKKEETNAIHSFVENLAGGDRTWTIKDLAQWGGIGGVGPVFVGSPATVADILQEWVEETDVSTLREKLFLAGPYLPENHPAAQYRDIEAFKRKQAERGAAAEWQVDVVQEVTA